MDIQFWIWLIVVVATLLSRALKKQQQKPPSPSQPHTDVEVEDHKPITFEELLKEIQASKTPPQPKPQAKPIKSYEVEEDEEEEDLETIPATDDRSYEVYEKAKREAFYRPSLEETLKLDDTIVKYDRFKDYDETSRKSLAIDVLNDFKDPEGFRKAFIMSEILKRKF